MTDASSDLRQAYYNKLNGAITVQNQLVPVYTFKSDPSKMLLIVLGNIAEVESGGNKSRFGKEVTVNVDIQHFITGKGSVTTTLIDQVSTQIQNMIESNRAGNLFPIGSNWKVISSRLLLSQQIHADTDTGQLMRKVLVFVHTIKQIL